MEKHSRLIQFEVFIFDLIVAVFFIGFGIRTLIDPLIEYWSLHSLINVMGSYADSITNHLAAVILRGVIFVGIGAWITCLDIKCWSTKRSSDSTFLPNQPYSAPHTKDQAQPQVTTERSAASSILPDASVKGNEPLPQNSHGDLQEGKGSQETDYRQKVLPSLISLIFCTIVFIICLITYSNDTSRLFGYNYRPPLTNHELMVVIFGVCSSIGALIDIVQLIRIQNKYKK